MDIKLKGLALDQFKGVKAFRFEPGGSNATIKAENGVGKTTVYDGFLWAMFGKNSEGKTAFGVRPLDDQNVPVPGIVVSVMVMLEIDGNDVTLTKRNIEKTVKREVVGFESEYEIDGVPKKKKEFDAYIAEIIDEEAFKMLTDLDYFNGKLHHTERRKILLDIAGNIPTPQGFDDLLEDLTGRKFEDYKIVVKNQKKKHEEERDKIPVQIGEIQRGYEEYAGNINLTELEGKRNGIKFKMEQIRTERDTTAKIEADRAKTTTTISDMRTKQAKIEKELASDTSGIQALMDEKLELGSAYIAADGKLQEAKGMLKRAVDDRDRASENVDTLRKSYADTKDKKVTLAKGETRSVDCSRDDCFLLAEFKKLDSLVDENNAKLIKEHADLLAKKYDDGKKAFGELKTLKDHVETCESSVKAFETALATAKKTRDTRTIEIDDAIKSNATTDPASDPVWATFETSIVKLEKDMPESVAEKLQELNDDYDAKQVLVDEINNILSQSDRVTKDKERIAELSKREKELAQLIADIDATLDQMDEYSKEESRLIESNVNNKFKHVEFKLFKECLNGNVEPDCVATYNGVPYADLSTGQKIYIGVDIVNVLSDHFGISAPLFLDHSESLTLPVEANSQVIRLQAVKNKKKLTVEIAE